MTTERSIRIDEIASNPLQSSKLDEAAINGTDAEVGGMQDSIERQGVLQAIRIRKTPAGAVDLDGNAVDRPYVVVFGTHRLVCVNRLHDIAADRPTLDPQEVKRWTTIPAVVVTGEAATDESSAMAMIAENTARREPKAARMDAILDLVNLIGRKLFRVDMSDKERMGQDHLYVANFGHGFYTHGELTARKAPAEGAAEGSALPFVLGKLAKQYEAEFATIGKEPEEVKTQQTYSISALARLFPGDSVGTIRRSFAALRKAKAQEARLAATAAAVDATGLERRKHDEFDVVAVALKTNKSAIKAANDDATQTREKEIIRRHKAGLSDEEAAAEDAQEKAAEEKAQDDEVNRKQTTAAKRIAANLPDTEAFDFELLCEELNEQSRLTVSPEALMAAGKKDQTTLDAIYLVTMQLALLAGRDTTYPRSMADKAVIDEIEAAKKKQKEEEKEKAAAKAKAERDSKRDSDKVAKLKAELSALRAENVAIIEKAGEKSQTADEDAADIAALEEAEAAE